MRRISEDDFWDELHYSSLSFKEQCLSNMNPLEDFGVYMNTVSERIHENNYPDKKRIIFYNTGSLAPFDHVTGTTCRPDYAAVEKTEDMIQWSAIETTVEIRSKGTNATDGPLQAVAYTSYLLQARPDRVSVFGMYADDHGVILIIVNSEQAKMSPLLDLTETQHVRLINAFVKRLYDPHSSMVDPTIKRKQNILGSYVFDITLSVPVDALDQSVCKNVDCNNYRILNASSSVGQRTHVFLNDETPAVVNGQKIPIIKDQYRDPIHRFTEQEIIERIHEAEDIPGVIRIAHAQFVLQEDGSPIFSGVRKKTRICMLEQGKPVMDITTPKDVLIAIYDLLEVTRFMYFKCQVLHRDISDGNVLYTHLEKTSPTPGEEDIIAESPGPVLSTNDDEEKSDEFDHRFCSINHLLHSSVEHYATSVLLVDFDRGEILDKKRKHRRAERTGTLMFMARAVRMKGPQGEVSDTITYPGVPELTPVARAAYERVFPDRLERFHSSPHTSAVGTDHSSWSHRLYHDAESAYWLLAWWAVTASPLGHPKLPVDDAVWSGFNQPGTKEDARNYRLLPDALDPLYTPLGPLLRSLGFFLRHDLFWASQEPHTHPEFLHEVFQRSILNFIVENRDEAFMNHPKVSSLRHRAEVTCFPALSFQEIERSRFHYSSGACTPSSLASSKRSRTFEAESDDSVPLKKTKRQ